MNDNIVRKILQHEATWLIMIVGSVLGFVNQVILPIQKIQIQLSQIQIDIGQTREDYKSAMAEHLLLKSRMDILETKVNK